jgi:ATP-dependent Clp protease ATP-binding subunit ClpC
MTRHARSVRHAKTTPWTHVLGSRIMWEPPTTRPTESRQGGKMNYDFTHHLMEVLVMAKNEAISLGHGHVEPEHVLLGILGQTEGVAPTVLTNLGVDLAAARRTVIETVGRGESDQQQDELIRYTEAAKRVLEFAIAEARDSNCSYCGTEHLLAALLRADGGVPVEALHTAGVSLQDVRTETLNVRASE